MTKRGITCILSVKVQIQVLSQTKDKLVSEVRPIVESMVSENLSNWFERNPKIVRLLLQRFLRPLLQEKLQEKQEKYQEKTLR